MKNNNNKTMKPVDLLLLISTDSRKFVTRSWLHCARPSSTTPKTEIGIVTDAFLFLPAPPVLYRNVSFVLNNNLYIISDVHYSVGLMNIVFTAAF